jgi:hypothetical protein
MGDHIFGKKFPLRFCNGEKIKWASNFGCILKTSGSGIRYSSDKVEFFRSNIWDLDGLARVDGKTSRWFIWIWRRVFEQKKKLGTLFIMDDLDFSYKFNPVLDNKFSWYNFKVGFRYSDTIIGWRTFDANLCSHKKKHGSEKLA